MKRFICIIIALSLVFASVLPVYAEAWTSAQATSVTLNLSALVQAFTGSVGTMYNSVSEMMSWLTPSGSFSSSHSITGVTLYEIVDYIAWTLSGVGPTVYQTLQDTCSSIVNSESLISAFKTQNNSNFSSLIGALCKLPSTFNSSSLFENSHPGLLLNSQGDYTIPRFTNVDLTAPQTTYQWQSGSPIGNVALMLRQKLYNDYYSVLYNKSHLIDVSDSNQWIRHALDTLSTWDSQQNTLTQINFTPESFAQALYRYLAYTQRDVARLAFVLASDEEIETREKARANQTEVLDDFVDPTGDGSLSTSDFGSMSDATADFKTNFNTGVSGSNIWNVFDNSHYNWFTQQTRNALDTTQQTRGNNDYPTPLLDEYYNEILSLFGDSER